MFIDFTSQSSTPGTSPPPQRYQNRRLTRPTRAARTGYETYGKNYKEKSWKSTRQINLYMLKTEHIPNDLFILIFKTLPYQYLLEYKILCLLSYLFISFLMIENCSVYTNYFQKKSFVFQFELCCVTDIHSNC